MPISSFEQLHKDLAADLKKIGSEGVVNDPARKTFHTRINGAIFEFGHNQSDPAYWSGVKHYGSGPSNRFRMHRTPRAPVAAEKASAASAVVKRAPRRKVATA